MQRPVSQRQTVADQHQVIREPGERSPNAEQGDAQKTGLENGHEKQQPVHYSLSDHDSAVETVPQNTSDEELIELGVDGTPILYSFDESSTPVEDSNESEIDEPIRFDSPPQPTVAMPIINQPPVVDELARRTPRTKPVKRYRPPVAVKTVPLEIERTLDGAAVDAPVHAVAEFEPNPTAVTYRQTSGVTPLQLNLTEVRSLTVGGDLQSIRVADPAVCKAVATGPRKVQLIGTSAGVTELFVLADGKEPGAKPRGRAFEIHVNDPVQTSGQSLHKKCELLNASIREAFPACEVALLQRDNELMVAGRCDSQSSAKKILRMVRKTCLVPVKDELIVQ
ncbi:MAG: hypothetical protein HKN47_21650 [Pirellulaceae bacterium]|nr:hypothetical protein [Pirellulaceae bacterium]